jgi:hypothetical protein
VLATAGGGRVLSLVIAGKSEFVDGFYSLALRWLLCTLRSH